MNNIGLEVISFTIKEVRDFFFSSRRRHTRCLSDWSSDVCSSDLAFQVLAQRSSTFSSSSFSSSTTSLFEITSPVAKLPDRKSGRVGKECKCRWSQYN